MSKNFKLGCCYGSVGRAVASDSRGLQFKSIHWQISKEHLFYCQVYWKETNKEKEAKNGPFKNFKLENKSRSIRMRPYIAGIKWQILMKLWSPQFSVNLIRNSIAHFISLSMTKFELCIVLRTDLPINIEIVNLHIDVLLEGVSQPVWMDRCKSWFDFCRVPICKSGADVIKKFLHSFF